MGSLLPRVYVLEENKFRKSLPGVVAAAVVTGVVVTLLPPDVDAEGGLTVSLKK